MWPVVYWVALQIMVTTADNDNMAGDHKLPIINSPLALWNWNWHYLGYLLLLPRLNYMEISISFRANR